MLATDVKPVLALEDRYAIARRLGYVPLATTLAVKLES